MSSASAYSAPVFNEKQSPSRVALANSASVPIYMWATNEPEDDDALHAPSPVDTKMGRKRGSSQPFILYSARGWLNVGTLGLLLAAILMLFIGYPVLLHVEDKPSSGPGFNLGGINGSGQVPLFPNFPSLIDDDTPQSAMTMQGTDGNTYNLVFSDEFNVDGRTFWPGDDPYWEAEDLHYWATGDLGAPAGLHLS